METNMKKTMERRRVKKGRKDATPRKDSVSITKRYFEDILRKVSKPISSQPEQGKKGT